MIKTVEQYLESLNDGWQSNPIYGKLLSVKEQVKMPPIDESYASIPKTAKKK